MSNGPKGFFNQTNLKHVQTTRYLGQKTFRLESSRSVYTASIKLSSSPSVSGYKIENREILLSLYADDCSIFLEYNPNNLENAIMILNDFYCVSGLKIHLTKTQCVVFGHIPNVNYKLCEHLSLNGIKNSNYLGLNLMECWKT